MMIMEYDCKKKKPSNEKNHHIVVNGVFVVWSYIYFYAFRTLPVKLVVIKIYVVAYKL